MLFHLFSQTAVGFVTLPPSSGGPLTLSTIAGAGTAIDLCNSFGVSIPNGTAIAGGQPVTLRDPAAIYVAPHGNTVRLDGNFWGNSQFVIKKVSGSDGIEVRHGDIVALGAVDAKHARRRRWLQFDFGPGQFILGGLALSNQGAAQQFQFFEANDVILPQGRMSVPLLISERLPNDVTSGVFQFDVTHEGLPNGSQYRLDIGSFDADLLRLGTGGFHAFPPSGEQLLITIPQGDTTFRLPIEANRPRVPGACALHADGGGSPLVGTMSLTSTALEPWAGLGRLGGDALDMTIVAVPAMDFLRIDVGPSPIELADGFVYGVHRLLATVPGPQAGPFTVTVRSGPQRLPPWRSGYTIMLSARAFPFAGFSTTSTTPVSPITTSSPTISMAANGSFTHAFVVGALPGGVPMSRDLFCLTVDVVPNGFALANILPSDLLSHTRDSIGNSPLLRFPPRFRREFALEVLPGIA